MKHVRIWFSKTGTAKYISHLDLNRCMSRAVHKAKLPLWYTEGFHPHAFLTFALPLSLGAEGLRESMDIKMEEDLCPEEIRDRLNAALPPDIRVLDVTEPVMKPGQIAWASYLVELEPEEGESGGKPCRKAAIPVGADGHPGGKTEQIRGENRRYPSRYPGSGDRTGRRMRPAAADTAGGEHGEYQPVPGGGSPACRYRCILLCPDYPHGPV